MGTWARFATWRRRRREVLAKARQEALEREAARVRRAFAAVEDAPTEKTAIPEGVEVRWGLAEDEGAIADLLELNGMPRWVAHEERFVVAEERGRVCAVVRYRTGPERLLLGLLVADPWRDERRLAVALYAGAGILARGLGAGEVLTGTGRRGGTRDDHGRLAAYLGEAGYVREIGRWRLDPGRPPVPRSPVVGAARGTVGELPEGGPRRWLALWGAGGVPFFRPFRG